MVEYNNVRNQEFIDITDEISNIYDALGQTDAASADSLRNLSENFNAHVDEFEDHCKDFEDHCKDFEDHIKSFNAHISSYNEHIEESNEHFNVIDEHVITVNNHIEDYAAHIEVYENHITDFNNHLTALEEHVEEFGNHIGNTLDYVQHVTLTDKNNWNDKLDEVVAGDVFVNVKNKNEVSVNVSQKITNSEENSEDSLPTTKAVKDFVKGHVNDPTAYVFHDVSPEDRKYYIIYDGYQNPTCFSEDFINDLVDGYRLFDYRSWQHYHIDMPNLITQYRMFHSNNNLMSFKSNLSSLTNYEGMFHGDTNLEYIDIVLTTNTITETKDCFTSCDKLKYVKLTCSNIESINTILAKIPENSSVKNKRLSLGHLDDNGAFVLYDESLFNSEKIASLKAAGWKINN